MSIKNYASHRDPVMQGKAICELDDKVQRLEAEVARLTELLSSVQQGLAALQERFSGRAARGV